MNDINFELESGLRCYCLLSQFPFFEAHFNVLYSLLGLFYYFFDFNIFYHNNNNNNNNNK